MALLETALAGLPKRQGKVRDVYDLGDRLLLVATDRISAFDWVLPNGIPDKGRVLTGLSAFWFSWFGNDVPNHFLSTRRHSGRPRPAGRRRSGRSRGVRCVVKKAEVVPFECVVRGYLSGSGWREYRQSGTVCGEPLPNGLVESDRLDPIFTPATKATTGHDENIAFGAWHWNSGADLAEKLRDQSLRVYQKAAAHARERGLILADTKFEWGHDSRRKS